jgi:hypothetical protein
VQSCEKLQSCDKAIKNSIKSVDETTGKEKESREEKCY